MPNSTTLIYEEGVFEDAIYTGVYTDVIDHVNMSTKRIHLRSGVREYHPVDDIYRELRYIRAKDESVRVVDMFIEATGNIPKGGGKFTPRLAIFKYGWRIVPANETHVLKVLGEQITDDGQSGAGVMDMTLSSPGVNVSIEYAPPDSEIVLVTTSGNEYSLAQISSAVWQHAAAISLADKASIAAAILRNKTITDPTTGMMTVYADDGITPLFAAQLYENADGTQAYRGQGSERRERLT